MLLKPLYFITFNVYCDHFHISYLQTGYDSHCFIIMNNFPAFNSWFLQIKYVIWSIVLTRWLYSRGVATTLHVFVVKLNSSVVLVLPPSKKILFPSLINWEFPEMNLGPWLFIISELSSKIFLKRCCCLFL